MTGNVIFILRPPPSISGLSVKLIGFIESGVTSNFVFTPENVMSSNEAESAKFHKPASSSTPGSFNSSNVVPVAIGVSDSRFAGKSLVDAYNLKLIKFERFNVGFIALRDTVVAEAVTIILALELLSL